VSDADLDKTIHQLAQFFGEQVDPRGRLQQIKLENNLKSAGLFDYYAKSLSGGD
jgi:hypothetical protein